MLKIKCNKYNLKQYRDQNKQNLTLSSLLPKEKEQNKEHKINLFFVIKMHSQTGNPTRTPPTKPQNYPPKPQNKQ